MTRTLWLSASVALLLAAVSVSFVVGYVSRQRQEMFIYGPSMAETLCGRHGRMTCPTCRHTLRFDLEEVAYPERIVCPNCGQLMPAGTPHDVLPGDRVRIQESKSPPQRFDVVALAVPGEQHKVGVKRIIGLPGELVSIRAGEIYLDGQLLQKDLAQQRELSTLVQEESAIGMNLPDSSWTMAGADSAWRELRSENVMRQFLFRPTKGDRGLEWLTFRLDKCFDSPGPAPTILLDNDSYNQTLARELNEVCDYRLSFLLGRPNAPGSRFVIAAHDGWRLWQIVIADEHIQIRQGEEFVARTPRATAEGLTKVEVSLCDEQLRVLLDGEQKVCLAAPGDNARRRQLPPDFLALGTAGPDRVIHGLELRRDIYYLNPLGNGQAWSMDQPLGPDEYFVLGDNPPVSIDSRQFGPVKADAIVGKVIRVEQ